MRHLLLILAVSVASCSPPSETLSAFDASGREALRFKKGAGPIVSTALPPAGSEPVKHPFVTARAMDASSEHQLGRILESSRDFEDFVANLKKAGFSVKPGQGEL